MTELKSPLEKLVAERHARQSVEKGAGEPGSPEQDSQSPQLSIESMDAERDGLIDTLARLRRSYAEVEAVHGKVKERREPLESLLAQSPEGFAQEGITTALGIAAKPDYGAFEETVEFGVARDELRDTLGSWQRIKAAVAADLGMENADRPATISMRTLEAKLTERIGDLEAQAQATWLKSSEGCEAAAAIMRRHRSVEAVHRILYAPEEFVKVEPEDVAAAASVPGGDRFVPGAAKVVLNQAIDRAVDGELRRLKIFDPARDVESIERSEEAQPQVQEALGWLAEKRRELAETLATACGADAQLSQALAKGYGLADGAKAETVAESVVAQLEGPAGLAKLTERFRNDVALFTTAKARLRLDEAEERKKVKELPDFTSYRPTVDFLGQLYERLAEKSANELVGREAATALVGQLPGEPRAVTLSGETYARITQKPYPDVAREVKAEVGQLRSRGEQVRAKVETLLDLRWAQTSLAELARAPEMHTALQRELSLGHEQREAATTLEQLPAVQGKIREGLEREYEEAVNAHTRTTRSLTYLTEAASDGSLSLTPEEKATLGKLSSAATEGPQLDNFLKVQVSRGTDGRQSFSFMGLVAAGGYLELERRTHELAAQALRCQVKDLEDSVPKVFGRGRHLKKVNDLSDVLSYEQQTLADRSGTLGSFRAAHQSVVESLTDVSVAWRVGEAFVDQRVPVGDCLAEVGRVAEAAVESELSEAQRGALERKAELERRIVEASAKLETLA